MNSPSDRYLTMLKAIDAERLAEATYFKNLNENKSLKQKIDAGIVWYPVDITLRSSTFNDWVEVEATKIKHLDTPHLFKEGVAAILFNNQDDQIDFKATITSVRKDKIKLLVRDTHQSLQQRIEKGLTGIELIYDDRPYKVMQRALQEVMQTEYLPHQRIRDAITVQTKPIEIDQPPMQVDQHVEYRTDINDSQRQAIKTACRASLISIIHGPPGTGKTTTLVALAETILKNEKQILVCAPSNNAVDLLAERLANKGISVLRVGNISRMDEEMLSLTLEQKMHAHPDWQQIKKVRILAQEADRNAHVFKRNFGEEERSERKLFRQEAKELRLWAAQLEDRLTDEILQATQVIATTLIGVSHKVLHGIKFKTVLIDEASQALEAECWNAILKADKVILAGDPMQLPPTVKSEEAKQLGMSVTLLDRMREVLEHVSLLTIQYRMNDKILGFPNQQFYDNQLQSAISVAQHFLPEDSYPLSFIDTAGCGFEEVLHPENRSLSNPGECQILFEHLIKNIAMYSGVSIGIISPYAEQVRWIKQQMAAQKQLAFLDIEVNTIDGFQGQEKEVIYMSLVRCNDKAEIGFLKDQRRLNVAMTRAQKKLVMIGDSATITSHAVFSDLIQYVEQNGHYQSAWEYLSV